MMAPLVRRRRVPEWRWTQAVAETAKASRPHSHVRKRSAHKERPGRRVTGLSDSAKPESAGLPATATGGCRSVTARCGGRAAGLAAVILLAETLEQAAQFALARLAAGITARCRFAANRSRATNRSRAANRSRSTTGHGSTARCGSWAAGLAAVVLLETPEQPGFCRLRCHDSTQYDSRHQ